MIRTTGIIIIKTTAILLSTYFRFVCCILKLTTWADYWDLSILPTGLQKLSNLLILTLFRCVYMCVYVYIHTHWIFYLDKNILRAYIHFCFFLKHLIYLCAWCKQSMLGRSRPRILCYPLASVPGESTSDCW